MDVTRQIQVAVARVASLNPAELTRQFSPLAKTTAVESKILIAVARADYFIVRYGFIVVRAAGLMLMAAGLRAVWRFLER